MHCSDSQKRRKWERIIHPVSLQDELDAIEADKKS